MFAFLFHADLKFLPMSGQLPSVEIIMKSLMVVLDPHLLLDGIEKIYFTTPNHELSHVKSRPYQIHVQYAFF